MKKYIAISGPQTIDVNSHENISQATEKYAKFVNDQAAAGWEYHSSSTIVVNKKGGCLRKDSAAKYKMMIFEREEASDGVPFAENKNHSQVSFETANTTDTKSHTFDKKWIIIALAVIIGIIVLAVLVIRIPMYFEKSKAVKPRMIVSEINKDTESFESDTASSVPKDSNESDTASTVPTDTEGKIKYVAAKGGLIIRSIPSTDGEMRGLIPDGTQVTVFSGNNGWAKVNYSGVEGWVSEDYLRDSKTTSSQSSGVVQPTERFEMGFHCTVRAEGGLCLRKGPDSSYDVISVIPDGTEIEEFGFENDWIFTEYEGQSGWVSSQYLEFAGGMAKPVIYLYPETETEVSVQLHLRDGDFSCTYPDYNNGWNVIARPDGTLINKADGKEYSYLFWESRNDTVYDFSKGFVVKGSDTAAFLQKSLSCIGLTPREYNEFIVYWLPLMQDNPYNLITFQQEAYTSAAVLDVSPKPDSILRVFMAYRPLEAPISIPEPTLSPFDRHGFTVVEWGGTEVH